MELLETLLKQRIKDIITSYPNPFRYDGKLWAFCQTGIQIDCHGDIVLVVSIQNTQDWKEIRFWQFVKL